MSNLYEKTKIALELSKEEFEHRLIEITKKFAINPSQPKEEKPLHQFSRMVTIKEVSE